MHHHDGVWDGENRNARTIDVLHEMMNYYDGKQDPFRPAAYKKAISILRRQTRKIITKDQAESLPGIGASLAAKIEEIVRTNRLERLEYIRNNPEDVAIHTFVKIHGVGYRQAHRWTEAGHRTIEHIRGIECELTRTQKIGLKHFDDLTTRIPRAEVEGHRQLVQHIISYDFKHLRFEIGGSFRRGLPDCGDIDFLFTGPGTIDNLRHQVFDKLIQQLERKHYIQDTLAAPTRGKNNNLIGSKWLGVAKLPDETARPAAAVVLTFLSCQRRSGVLRCFTLLAMTYSTAACAYWHARSTCG